MGTKITLQNRKRTHELGPSEQTNVSTEKKAQLQAMKSDINDDAHADIPSPAMVQPPEMTPPQSSAHSQLGYQLPDNWIIDLIGYYEHLRQEGTGQKRKHPVASLKSHLLTATTEIINHYAEGLQNRGKTESEIKDLCEQALQEAELNFKKAGIPIKCLSLKKS